MMKRLIVVACALSLLGFTAEMSSAAPNIKEGLWEITTQIEMPNIPNMPAFMNRPMTHKQCITKNDAVPKQQPQKDRECKVVDQKIEGNVVTWKTICKGKDSTTEGTGKVTWKGNSYDGVMTTKSSGKQAMNSTMKFSGRYLGACTQ